MKFLAAPSNSLLRLKQLVHCQRIFQSTSQQSKDAFHEFVFIEDFLVVDVAAYNCISIYQGTSQSLSLLPAAVGWCAGLPELEGLAEVVVDVAHVRHSVPGSARLCEKPSFHSLAHLRWSPDPHVHGPYLL